jgi:long-chain acyl-CoA synthetase
MDSEGYFDTGDLGRINPATGDLILTGRAKDTIVLSNGEMWNQR